MRVLRFDILNNKAISSWVHDANGEHVQISGGCGEGKTTAASALWSIMSKSPDCLTHGERKGHIVVHLGEDKPVLIARRDFTKKTNTVTIEKEGGGSVSVKDFRDMISTLSENPHKISEMKPTERVQTLLQAADIGDVDLGKLDEQIEAAEQVRLESKRRADDFIPGNRPEKVVAVDVSALSKELEKASEHNADYETNANELKLLQGQGTAAATAISEQEDVVTDLELRISDAKEKLKSLVVRRNDIAEAFKAQRDALAEMSKVDTSETQVKLATATEVNSKASAYEQWEERNKKYNELMQKRDCADEAVKELRDDKRDLLEGAKWPLEGLSIEDGDIMYNGSLFENLGQSEQHLVCAALAVKDILAHPLHVCRMDGVESLSKEDFKKLQDLFGENEIQVISTRVARDDVEDGELVITEKEG